MSSPQPATSRLPIRSSSDHRSWSSSRVLPANTATASRSMICSSIDTSTRAARVDDAPMTPCTKRTWRDNRMRRSGMRTGVTRGEQQRSDRGPCSHSLRVAIAGGGIGGMALALSLHAAGFSEVDVYESAPSVKELGVGINVLPHATRELTELGLLDTLYSQAIPTAELAYYSRHGQRIWSEPRGIAAGYRWPQFSIHRGTLLGVLYRAVLERLGPERVHSGHHLSRFHQDARGVSADFVERAGGEPRAHVEADVLVGCDGIHSVVRHAFFPSEGPP